MEGWLRCRMRIKEHPFLKWVATYRMGGHPTWIFPILDFGLPDANSELLLGLFVALVACVHNFCKIVSRKKDDFIRGSSECWKGALNASANFRLNKRSLSSSMCFGTAWQTNKQFSTADRSLQRVWQSVNVRSRIEKLPPSLRVPLGLQLHSPRRAVSIIKRMWNGRRFSIERLDTHFEGNNCP